MSLLVLIRHAKSARKKAPAGSTDWPLSKKGRKSCHALAALLRPLGLDVLVSSPMLRARQTSELLAEEISLEWRVVDGLEEHKPPFVTPPASHESPAEALARYTAAVDSVLAQETARNVGVVSHGNVMALYGAPRFGRTNDAMFDAIRHPWVLVIDRETGRGVQIIDSFPDAK